MKRIRGLIHLAGDAIVHGATAVETVHKATTERTFAVLEAVPVVAGPASLVHLAHDAVAAVTYASVRTVTRAVTTVADAGVSIYERSAEPPRDS